LCPGKYILPLLVGDTNDVVVNFKSATTIVMSVLGLIFSVIVIIGAFVKRRFWCPYCPLGLFLSWYKKFSFLKLKKIVRNAPCARSVIMFARWKSNRFLRNGRMKMWFLPTAISACGVWNTVLKTAL